MNLNRIFGIVYLLVGLYLLALGFNFIPDALSGISKWVVPVGGAFLVISGVKGIFRRAY